MGPRGRRMLSEVPVVSALRANAAPSFCFTPDPRTHAGQWGVKRAPRVSAADLEVLENAC